MTQLINLDPANGLAEASLSFAGGAAALMVTLTLRHSEAGGEDVVVETELDAAAVIRMRARLQQDVSLDVARPQRAAAFIIQIGIYRLAITSIETGFSYVLSEGPFILGSVNISNKQDRAMREQLGLDDLLKLSPAAEKCRRPEASDEAQDVAAEVAGR